MPSAAAYIPVPAAAAPARAPAGTAVSYGASEPDDSAAEEEDAWFDVEEGLGEEGERADGSADGPAPSARWRAASHAVALGAHVISRRRTHVHAFGSRPSTRIDIWLEEMDLSTADMRRDRDAMFLLLENRSYGYPGTDGTLLSNYLAYCLNRHPLISIITAHPLHPFTRAERVIVLLCSFCWAFFVKSMMHRPALVAQAWYVYYTALALLVIPYEIVIRVFAVCACVQYDDSAEGVSKKRRWECYGRTVLAALTLSNLAFIGWGVYSTLHAYHVLKLTHAITLFRQSWTTIVAKLWAMVVWFPLWQPVFLLWYNHDKARWVNTHPPADPCHLCASTTEDTHVHPLYWLLVTARLRPPAAPRRAAGWTAAHVPTLPVIDPKAKKVSVPALTALAAQRAKARRSKSAPSTIARNLPGAPAGAAEHNNGGGAAAAAGPEHAAASANGGADRRGLGLSASLNARPAAGEMQML